MRDLVAEIANPLFAVGVLLFLSLLFAAIVYWVWFRTPKDVHEKHAQIPLEDQPVEPKNERRGKEDN